jgi:tRNA threonylcarbamoyladenosine biosynthesis protein TsaE
MALASRKAVREAVALQTLADTERLARRLARTLRGGEVIALTGPLGSGKTTFVQFLANALGVKQNVRSPSFIVLQIFKLQAKSYKLKATMLCHVDAYRLKDAHELEALGLHDYLGQPHVITVIEWAEKVAHALPRYTWWLQFRYDRHGRSVALITPLPKIA